MAKDRHTINQKAARTPQERAAFVGGMDALAAALVEYGPILARLAAADTVHTTEHPETVFRRAIAEGIQARNVMRAMLAEDAAQ